MIRIDLHVRLPATLHERLLEDARKNDRSLNAEITQILRAHYEGWKLDRVRS